MLTRQVPPLLKGVGDDMPDQRLSVCCAIWLFFGCAGTLMACAERSEQGSPHPSPSPSSPGTSQPRDPSVTFGAKTPKAAPRRPDYSEPIWSPVSISDDCYYMIDKNTIRNSPDGYAIVWVMMSCDTLQKLPDGRQYFSKIDQRAIDCSNFRDRYKTIISYSDKLGSGSVVETTTFTVEIWHEIVPGSVGAGLFSAVCNGT